MLSTAYRFLTDAGAPLIALYLRRRRAAGREDVERFDERFGFPSRPRPDGRVVWFHAASVGESASLLLLIEKLHELHTDITVLLTTGTVSSARMIAARLPVYAIHQYMPIDRVPCLTRFLNHWRPDLAIWIESELWPNTLAALREQGVPAVLLNARMSEKSFRTWYRFKGFAHELLSTFSLCLAQTESDRSRFVALGATPVKCLGNLKYASVPLPCDAQELSRLQAASDGRDVWLAASTHRGEEEMALAAHKALVAKHPRLLTVIAPRHPARGDEIERLVLAAGLRVARRSRGDALAADTQVYLADTLGEMGVLYAWAPIAVVGGSFVPTGGHNPIEPAQSGSAVIFGPSMFNFSEIAREFLLAQAAVQIQHANEMAFAVERLLTDTDARARLAHAARLLADSKRTILDHIAIEMDPWLKG